MNKYEALLEDANDLIGGSPVSRYWDVQNQLSKDLIEDEFDKIVERIVALEGLLSETHDYEEIDDMVSRFCATKYAEMDELKKSTYLELTGKLIYRMND